MNITTNPSSFEWDEDKRTKALEKHGIDFADAVGVFDRETLVAPSKHGNEERWVAIGLLEGIEIAVILTMRSDVCRIITARRARRYEREIYQARYPGGGSQAQGPD